MNRENNEVTETYINGIGDQIKSQYIPIKSTCDFLMALVLVIVTLPFVLLAVFAIKIESRGPVFYKQSRVGLMGEHIMITKLRSMYVDAEKNGAQWANKNDSRVTHVGKFIRKTRIDELPQLWNVLKGEMSLIGPRPERPAFTEKFSHEFPGFEQRLRIKPGLSGYAQVHGGYDIDPGQKAELDCFYIDHFSIEMDIEIFFDTIRTIITGKGAR